MSWLRRLLRLAFGRRRASENPRPARREPSKGGAPAASVPHLAAPASAFTPTRPKSGRRQVVGRDLELSRIVQALIDERAHVVIYSERGRGKTSLANLATETLRREQRMVARYTCEASTTFDTLIRGLARDLPASLLAGIEPDGEGCEGALPPEPLKPRDVANFPSHLLRRDLVWIVDEFDRIEDEQTRTLFADTIKQVSDRGIALSFVIVGVSENLEQILGQHPSIQRNITAIHLPLLSDPEIAAMLERGGRDTGLTFSPGAVARVSLVARGMPYMAQLLGLRIAQATLARGAQITSDADVDDAIDRLLADARHHVVAQYDRLTDRGRDHAAVHALRRIAMGEQDRWGRLTLIERDGSIWIGGQEVAPAQWAKIRDEGILRPTEQSPDLLTFADRTLTNHVLLLAVRDIAPEGSATVTPLTADARARRPVAANGR